MMSGRRLSLYLAAILSIGALGVTFAKRQSAANAAERIAPGTSQTSGCEVESFFAVWRAAHHHPVYADLGEIPFASAYFNWLFYEAYGALVRPSLQAHGDAVLPHVARRITVIGALIGGILAVILFTRITGPADAGLRWLAAALGVALFFGPLPGWWVVTVRPDIWALVFETGGVALLLFAHRKRPHTAVIGAALLFFAAWSCKQTFVGAAAAAGVFLMVRRRWRDAALLIAICCSLAALAIALLGPEYRASLQETARAAEFHFGIGFANARSAASKILPLLFGIPLVFQAFRSALRPKATPSPAADAVLLGSIGAVLSVLLMFPASCKIGAGPNYYFTASLMLSLAVLGAIALRQARWTPAIVGGVLVLLSFAPLTGRIGRLDLRPDAERLARRWEFWRTQPEPRYSSDLALNLPWLVVDSPPLVQAYNYFADREQGRHFEAGGIGGLIASGYFASLLLPASVDQTFDRGSLVAYERTNVVEDLAYYRRRDSVSADPGGRP